jgi:hypothetical protein
MSAVLEHSTDRFLRERKRKRGVNNKIMAEDVAMTKYDERT